MRRSKGEGSWQTKTISGNEYHVYRITIDGVRKSFYGKTKQEAMQKYKNYTPSTGDKDCNAKTFYQYCHDWLFDVRAGQIKQKTFDYYDFIIETFIKDTDIGDMTIKRLNQMGYKEGVKLFQGHINGFCSKSKSTLDGLHTVMNQVCKYGVTYQDFTNNFMAGVNKISEKNVEVKKKEIESLEYDDVMKLWKEMLRKNEEGDIVNGKVGTYVYGIGAYALLFSCFTGLRWGELSCLQWKDIKQDGGTWYFRVDKQFVTIRDRAEDAKKHYMTVVDTPKSEKSDRYIPLSDKAVELLQLIQQRFPDQYVPDHLIFSATDKPYSNSSANRLLKAMCIRSGVPVVSPHTLRHSFASILLNEDAQNLYTVSNLLGHSSTDVTYKKYIDIFEKNKIETIKIFNNMDK